jgi:hypothetical protein
MLQNSGYLRTAKIGVLLLSRRITQFAQAEHPSERHGEISATMQIFRRKPATKKTVTRAE